jgi:hypothetical protein
MSARSSSGALPASSAARVRASSPTGRAAARARISTRTGPSSKSRRATSNLPAWAENLSCLKFAVIALSLGV